MAVLELEENKFIQEWQFLKMRWNWKRSLIFENFFVVSYPSDRQDKPGNSESYNQFMEKGKLIAIYDNWIKYSH